MQANVKAEVLIEEITIDLFFSLYLTNPRLQS